MRAFKTIRAEPFEPVIATHNGRLVCNGHSWLACQLTAAGIDFAMADNAFVRI
jgi:hypothetical protein